MIKSLILTLPIAFVILLIAAAIIYALSHQENCPRCGKKIKPSYNICPYCSYRLNKEENIWY